MRLGTLGACLSRSGRPLALWSVATQLAFDAGAVLDYGDPLAALLVGTAGTVMLGMWADSRERQRLRELFAAGAGGIVEQVLHRPGGRPLEPTAIIAGYRIEEVLGRGGMGVVYRATQLALERAVAIKLIASERAGDPVFRERFSAESRIAASIEHANVIPVYEAGEDDGLLFIAMRLVEGLDLGRLLARPGPLAPERTVRVIAPDRRSARRGSCARPRAQGRQARQRPAHRRSAGARLSRRTSASPSMWARSPASRGPTNGSARSTTWRRSRFAARRLDARADIYALTGCLLPLPHR